MSGSTTMLAAVMVLCLVGGVYQAARGRLGRCLLFLTVGLAAAGYVVLQAFVPGGAR